MYANTHVRTHTHTHTWVHGGDESAELQAVMQTKDLVQAVNVEPHHKVCQEPAQKRGAESGEENAWGKCCLSCVSRGSELQMSETSFLC